MSRTKYIALLFLVGCCSMKQTAKSLDSDKQLQTSEQNELTAEQTITERYFYVPFIYTNEFQSFTIECTENFGFPWREAIEHQDYNVEMINETNWSIVTTTNYPTMLFRVRGY